MLHTYYLKGASPPPAKYIFYCHQTPAPLGYYMYFGMTLMGTGPPREPATVQGLLYPHPNGGLAWIELDGLQPLPASLYSSRSYLGSL